MVFGNASVASLRRVIITTPPVDKATSEGCSGSAPPDWLVIAERPDELLVRNLHPTISIHTGS